MGNNCLSPFTLFNDAVFDSDSLPSTTTSTTTRFNYIASGLTLTPEEVDHVRDLNFRSLLSHKKLHLVLDLEHTLIHTTYLDKLTMEQRQKVQSGMFDDTFVLNGSIVLKLRPGVRTFLEQARTMFELSIYTMGCRYLARKVAELLDPRDRSSLFGGSIRRVISREDCTTKKRKGLDVVLSHRRVVLVLDDKEWVWDESDKANVITLEPYEYFGGVESWDESENKDGELDRVLSVLKDVHSRFYDEAFEGEIERKDVRQVLRGVKARMGLTWPSRN